MGAIIKYCKEASGDKLSENESPSVFICERRSRKRRLRYRYYQVKIKLEDLWERAVGLAERTAFRKLLKYFRRLHLGNRSGSSKLDASTNTEIYQEEFRKSIDSHCCYQQKHSLIFEADDEESELEPGEVPEPYHFHRVRVKQRGRRRRAMAKLVVSRDSSKSNRSRKRRSSLTRRRRPLARTNSEESLKTLASGDIKGDPENPKEDIEQKNSRTEVSCQTEDLKEDSTAKENTTSLAPEIQPTIESWTPPTVNEPDAGKSTVQGLMEYIMGLSSRKRKPSTKPKRMKVGFKLVPVTGQPGRIKKKQNTEPLPPPSTPFVGNPAPYSSFQNYQVGYARPHTFQYQNWINDNIGTSAIGLGSTPSPRFNNPKPLTLDTILSSISSGTTPTTSSLPFNSIEQPPVFPSLGNVAPDLTDMKSTLDKVKSDSKDDDDDFLGNTSRLYEPKTQFTAKFYSLLHAD